jgi:hypothetical protein
MCFRTPSQKGKLRNQPNWAVAEGRVWTPVKRQSSSLNSGSAWDSQEIPKDCYRLQNNPECVPRLKTINTLHSLSLYFFKMHFNIVIPSRLIPQLLQPYPLCISLNSHACQPYQLCRPPQ